MSKELVKIINDTRCVCRNVMAIDVFNLSSRLAFANLPTAGKELFMVANRLLDPKYESPPECKEARDAIAAAIDRTLLLGIALGGDIDDTKGALKELKNDAFESTNL
jgi:hypothetical protein